MTTTPRRILLCADDYALTDGVSSAISELAQQGRLSATSALVTTPVWHEAAVAVTRLRADIAVGLHLNLTLGAPLGPMAVQASAGRFPPVSAWVRRGLIGRVRTAEVEAEIDRQFEAFEAVAGSPPDHVDGHHHVHALPGVRMALAGVLARRFARGRMPLIRVPGDDAMRILGRGANPAKALAIAALTARSGSVFRNLGAPVNDGFAGFSSFRRSIPFGHELERFTRTPGPAHMVMCHPGFADATLDRLDPVSARREDELCVLLADRTLPARILHPARHRNPDGFIDWTSLLGK